MVDHVLQCNEVAHAHKLFTSWTHDQPPLPCDPPQVWRMTCELGKIVVFVRTKTTQSGLGCLDLGRHFAAVILV